LLRRGNGCRQEAEQYVMQFAQTAIQYPPMQASASFNLDAVKRQVKLREGN